MQVATQTQNGVQYKTCLVTLVTPGHSDRVLKVFPAEHDAEKIWLTNTQGVERWEAIERLMNNFAERGTRVAKPVPYHEDSRSLAVVTLKPEDIPTVRLDGMALTPPPTDEFAPAPANNIQSVQDLNKKVEDLTGLVASLATNVSHLTQAISKTPAQVAEAPRRGRPPKNKEV